MNRVFLIIMIFSLLIFLFFTGCSRKEPQKIDETISQKDINLVILHKKNIDSITGRYDKLIAKSKNEEKHAFIERGKAEINSYLESNGIVPVEFMRKTKKILKGYIAFKETGYETIEKRKAGLKKEGHPEAYINEKVEIYKKSGELLFKELTAGLSDYEIELIKSNLPNISEVITESN